MPRAEGGGDAHGRGLGMGGVAGEHARRPVGQTKARNAEARNAGQIAGLALVDRAILLRAVDEGELLLERHLAQQLVNAGIAGHDRHALRN